VCHARVKGAIAHRHVKSEMITNAANDTHMVCKDTKVHG
jgi:hypothetical protein